MSGAEAAPEAPITVVFIGLSASRPGAAEPRVWSEDELRHAGEVVARCVEDHGGYEQLGAVDQVGRLCREMALQLSWSGRWREGLQT